MKKAVLAIFNGEKQKARFLLFFVFRGVETTPLQNGAPSMRRTDRILKKTVAAFFSTLPSAGTPTRRMPETKPDNDGFPGSRGGCVPPK